jgi:hypothetical protein
MWNFFRLFFGEDNQKDKKEMICVTHIVSRLYQKILAVYK